MIILYLSDMSLKLCKTMKVNMEINEMWIMFFLFNENAW